MAFGRLGRAATLLLVLWLTADVAAYGFCTPPFPDAAADTATVSAATQDSDSSDAAPVCCGAHHCFCCSSSVEVAAFALTFSAQAVLVESAAQTSPADISVQSTSPPPRF